MLTGARFLQAGESEPPRQVTVERLFSGFLPGLLEWIVWAVPAGDATRPAQRRRLWL
jgi:hypothetical protein